MVQAPAEGYLRIGALSRRVGISPTLLRAWEKRYGLLRPSRSQGNFRLYSAADEQAVLTMKRHMARGLSTAQAARLALGERPEGPSPAPGLPDWDREQAALGDAALRFDEAAVQAIIDRAFALWPLEEVLTGLVLPCLRAIGDGWEQAEISVAQEHFASNILRLRLLGLSRGWESGSGSPALLACVPGEWHDIGLVCFGLTLWRRGWRIVYLGQATPIDDMRSGMSSVNAGALVVHAHSKELLAACAGEIRSLAHENRIAITGAAATAATAEDLGTELLDGDPVNAALEADRRWRRSANLA